MPFSSASRALLGPRRRSLLASAAGAALLVGCSAGSDASGDGPSPDDRARARAARDSQALVERYDAVIAAHPALAARLRPLRAEVAAHRDAFGGAATASPGAGESRAAAGPRPSAGATAEDGDGASSPAAAPSASVPGATGVPSVPGDAKEALAQLAAAERSLADRRARALLGVPGELARLLASVAAAGAAHAYLLTEGDR
ncbi:hypothetical protein ACF1A5_32630 [Streptomyces sp. NPDC014864]|uniref:hypothetical protein n=1 Tax=Streptomyces sp. NPDC014864 TaxID=3364924 RepID=UPI0036FDDD92